MKKLIIILFFIFLLITSFVLGFFVKKQIDDERIDSLNLTKIMLENKNEKYAEEIISLNKIVKKLKALKSNNWEKISDDVYIDKKSITKNKNSISAWFIIFSSEEHSLYDFDGIPVHHDINKYEVYCKTNAICLDHIKQFDENGNILLDEPDTYGICPSPSGWLEKDIVYKTLCKCRKKGK